MLRAEAAARKEVPCLCVSVCLRVCVSVGLSIAHGIRRSGYMSHHRMNMSHHHIEYTSSIAHGIRRSEYMSHQARTHARMLAWLGAVRCRA